MKGRQLFEISAQSGNFLNEPRRNKDYIIFESTTIKKNGYSHFISNDISFESSCRLPIRTLFLNQQLNRQLDKNTAILYSRNKDNIKDNI